MSINSHATESNRMTESASPGAKPAKSSLGKHALLLFMGLILFGNLYVIFSLRETLSKYENKINDIQSNTNIISDRFYNMDARLEADELTLAEVRDSSNETAALLELTQQQVDDSSIKLTTTMGYLDQMAEALEYGERLGVEQIGTAAAAKLPPFTSASQPSAAVDPEGSMEWTTPMGKKHTVKFRRGRVIETIE